MPTPYDHPKYPNIKFWDLPGLGTPNHPDLETYRQKVQLDKYHTFLIFSCTRFTECDSKLAKEIKRQGKSFFFIRTKIDENVRAEKRKKSFSEAALLQKIRCNCMEKLVDEAGNPISSEDDIFLTSNFHPGEWDFSRLTEAILDALPRYKREALTMALDTLSSLSKGILMRKVALLKGRMILIAGLSGAAGAAPVPGLSIPVDIFLIVSEIKEYNAQLGIPVEGSKIFEALSLITRKEISKIQLQLISIEKCFSLFGTEVAAGLVMEEATRFIPIVGLVIAGTVSFGRTLLFLRTYLKKFEKIALKVLEEAGQKSLDSKDRE